MRSGRYFWKLFLGNAVLMASVLGVCIWLILHEFEQFHKEETGWFLTAQAEALVPLVLDRYESGSGVELDAIAKECGSSDREGIRFTFVAIDGTVLGDSEGDPSQMDNHAGRPEIVEAIRTGRGRSSRWSYTVARELDYAAVRVGPADAPLGVVRAAMTERTIGHRTESARRLIMAVGLTAFAATVVLALGLARLWSSRLGRISSAARNLSEGDLSTVIQVSGRDEVAALARSLNRMRLRLNGHLQALDGHRRTLDALIAQLNEGVIVALPDGRIVLMNPCAARMLHVDVPHDGTWLNKEGLVVEHCVSQPELQELLCVSPTRDDDARSAALDASGSTVPDRGAQEIRVDVRESTGVKTLLARAADIELPQLLDRGPRRIRRAREDHSVVGRLVVLTDITDLQQMIQVKADFAANASHELRTPLSAIRAAVETLRSLDVAADAGSVVNCINVIQRHSERMQSLVADLLDLARVEAPTDVFESAELQIRGVLKNVTAGLEPGIRDKNLSIEISMGPECETVVANPDLMRIVLRNLLENAIRFSHRGGAVRVSAHRRQDRVVVAVSDDGCGIPHQDQERVFERFYQVERSRSGEKRGTGLGLSIVRHSVTAMGGHVSLESAPNVGTTVSFEIPSPAATTRA